MADYGMVSVWDIWGRFLAIIFIGYFLYTCHRRVFPIKLRGAKKPFFYYTGWRILPILGVPVIMQAVPLLLLGDGFNQMIQTRDTFLAALLFSGNIIGIPLTIIITTILQIRANRSALRKHKNGEI